MRVENTISVFCFGAVAMLSFCSILLLAFPSSDDDHHADKFYTVLPIFRITFYWVFILLGTSLCLRLYRQFKVNYMFMFEMDPHFNVPSNVIFRVIRLFSRLNFILNRLQWHFYMAGFFVLVGKYLSISWTITFKSKLLFSLL